jgi:hypothetical protein
MAQGIGQQIAQHLGQAVGIGLNGRQHSVRLERQVDLLGLDGKPETGDGPI